MAGNRHRIEAYADDQILRTLSQHCCVGCGECCRWPGQVIVYTDDIRRIASELHLDRESFLSRFCVVVWWSRESFTQFRIALARKKSGTGCVFLEGMRCTIHEFKPLKCKAGPSDWSWIGNPEEFWYYVDKSPSFRHPEGTFAIDTANQWFTATRDAEVVASEATSLAELARMLQVHEDVLKRLPLLNYREDVESQRINYKENMKCQ
jgi:uncharacterized protein